LSKSIKKTPVELWAQTNGLRTSDVIYMIKSQDLPGVKVRNQWYVLSSFIDTGFEIESESSKNSSEKEKPDKKSIGRKIIDWLSPKYDEVTLFIMSCTVIGLTIIDIEFRSLIVNIMIVDQQPELFITAFLFLAGFILALVQNFIDHEKTEVERWLMLFFAIMVQAASGFFAAIYLLENSTSNFYWVFPTWNFLYSFILLLFFRLGVIDIDRIIYKGTNRLQLLLSGLVVISFILFAHYIINYHWSIIISISIALAGSLSYSLNELNPYLKNWHNNAH